MLDKLKTKRRIIIIITIIYIYIYILQTLLIKNILIIELSQKFCIKGQI